LGLINSILATFAIFKVNITWFVFKGIILAALKPDQMFCFINAPIKALKNPAKKILFCNIGLMLVY
jgi:hypothetical protein